MNKLLIFVKGIRDQKRYRRWLERKSILEKKDHYQGFIVQAHSANGRLMGCLAARMSLWMPWPPDQIQKGHIHRLSVGEIENAVSPELQRGCEISLYLAEKLYNENFVASKPFKLKPKERKERNR